MSTKVKKRILVVDDEVNWLTTIKNLLKSEYDLTLTMNPEESLKAVTEASFSLVILDMKFPNHDISGLEVFAKMRIISPELRAIILTGEPPETEVIRKSFKTGVLDYLEKQTPDLFNELPKTVREAIGDDIISLIANGESERLEFKSTARWDIRAGQANPDLGKVIVKTVAGFLNSEIGGTVLIGIDDSGQVIGLQLDYDSLSKKNRDGYENFLNNLLLNAFGKDISLFLHTTFHEVEGKDICRIDAKSSPKPIFVVEDKGDYLYIRVGNSTRALSTREAIDYVKSRWKS